MKPSSGAGHHHRPRLLWVLSHAAVMGAAFWLGSEYGTRFTATSSPRSDAAACQDDSARLGRASQLQKGLRHEDDARGGARQRPSPAAEEEEPVEPWTLPEQVRDFIGGVARVSRQDFLRTYDDGLPADDDTPGNQEVLLFYDSKDSLPNRFRRNLQPFGSAAEATENCRYMRVISVDPERDDAVCLAIQGNNAEPHYHIHKWLQDPADGTFHQVSRYRTTLDTSDAQRTRKEAVMAEPPKPAAANAANKVLQHYLSHYDEYAEALKPVLAGAARDNAVVAVVCNAGQADLLRNYACAARLRGVLPSNLVVFAMDAATREVAATGLGLATFYHPLLFSAIEPQAPGSSGVGEAAEYGSPEYARIMLAKLFVPHLVTDAGYDLLFHDVDMVPYRDYYAHLVDAVAPKYPGFELYMSYDFTTDDMYAPWGANSGLWYARNTDRTRYFFSLLLRRAALVLKTRSHQAAMSVVMSDVANHYGLRVKVLDRHGRDFPVGYHFHHDWDYMKQLMRGEAKPYLLHMNWNHHKDVKVKFLQQMNEWFVDPASEAGCVDSPEPVCHYKDKPSIIPCPNSPAIETGVSFW